MSEYTNIKNTYLLRANFMKYERSSILSLQRDGQYTLESGLEQDTHNESNNTNVVNDENTNAINDGSTHEVNDNNTDEVHANNQNEDYNDESVQPLPEENVNDDNFDVPECYYKKCTDEELRLSAKLSNNENSETTNDENSETINDEILYSADKKYPSLPRWCIQKENERNKKKHVRALKKKIYGNGLRVKEIDTENENILEEIELLQQKVAHNREERDKLNAETTAMELELNEDNHYNEENNNEMSEESNNENNNNETSETHEIPNNSN